MEKMNELMEQLEAAKTVDEINEVKSAIVVLPFCRPTSTTTVRNRSIHEPSGLSITSSAWMNSHFCQGCNLMPSTSSEKAITS